MRIGQGKPGPGRPKGSANKPSAAINIYEDLIGSFKHDLFYVYAHYIDQELIYIGKGKGGRAWEVKSSSRNDEWWSRIIKAMEDGVIHNVRIIAAGLEEEEALAIERELIRIRRPSCNVVYGQLALIVNNNS